MKIVKTKNIALPLLLSSFSLSLFLFVFSMPFIGIGHWPQSEIAVALFHFSAATCTFALLFVYHKNRRLLLSVYLHPVTLISIGIALLSITLALTTTLPIRSFLGSPQVGEGALWWINTTILIVSALILCRLKIYRVFLGIVALASAMICLSLSVAHKYFGILYAPFYFPDFNAFQLLCLLPVIFGLLHKYSIRETYLWSGLYLGFLGLMYLTENHIGLAFAAIGFLYFLILWLVLPTTEKYKRYISYLTLSVLPVFVLIFSAIVLSIPADSGYYGYKGFGPIQTIFSRAYLIDMAMKPLWAEPISFLTGQGWGTFDEHITLYMPTEWLDLTLQKSVQWDGITTDHFHSHNILIETLSAIGMIAALLVYALFLVIPMAAKKTYQLAAFIFASGLASLTAFWFIFALHIPFIALAIGYLGMKPRKADTFRKILNPILPLMLLGFFILQLGGAAATYFTARSAHHYIAAGVDIDKIESDCPQDYRDFGAGGLHLAMIMTKRLRYISWQASTILESSDPQETIDDMKEGMRQVNHLFCQSSQYIENRTPSARLQLARLLIRAEILLSLGTYLDQETLDYYYRGWEDDLEAWLERAPTRTDQAVPFFLWHILNDRENVSKALIYKVYETNPEDPVGLWFRGLFLTKKPSTAREGLILMKRGLDNGIERFMPIDEGLKNQLLGL